MQLLKYRRSDGQIEAIYESEVPDLLALQRREDDEVYGYLLAETPLVLADQERYEVLAGAIVAKAESHLTGTPTPFAADGQATCTVTVSPFHPCILDVHGVPYILTASDPVLVISSDVPAVFPVRLVRMPGMWALPISVEAV